MNWKAKARIQRVAAVLPPAIGDRAYFWMQKRFGAWRGVDVDTDLRKARELIGAIHARGGRVRGKAFVELGVGRTLNTEIGLWLCGGARLVGLDIHRYLSDELVRLSLHWMEENPARVRGRLLSGRVDVELFEARLAALLVVPRTAQAILDLIAMTYRAPWDAARMPFLGDGTVDYHLSTNVLEHVPVGDLERILAEAQRLLSSSGMLVHRVDCSDHFSHSDPSITAINFLRFSEAEWASWASNRFGYHNRLRAVDYPPLFERAGLRVLHEQPEIDDASLAALRNGFPVDPGFAAYTPEQLATVKLTIVAAR